ncbi:MAG: pyridoxal-phosphate dependent enzyme [Chloroflexota bacterium]
MPSSQRLPSLTDVIAAQQRLRGVALHTPLQGSRPLAEESGAAEVRLKLELLQPTGAFKIRGASNAVALRAADQPDQPLVTASTGNHALAMADAAERHNMTLSILVGGDVSTAKLGALRATETDRLTIEIVGRSADDAEAEGRRRGDAGIATYISPYNDADVVAGQATVGLEILEDWPEVDTIVVPVGGGGLISGIGLWVKSVKPEVRIVGVQPSASPPLYAFLQSGGTKPMPIAPTLADGVAGNVERDSITWKLVKRHVDEIVLVEEDEIADAMRWAIETPHLLVEGSAALGIAALRMHRAGDLGGHNVAVVLSGRSVGADVVRDILGRA